MNLQSQGDEFATVYLPSRNLDDNTRATYLRVVDACLPHLAVQDIRSQAVGMRHFVPGCTPSPGRVPETCRSHRDHLHEW